MTDTAFDPSDGPASPDFESSGSKALKTPSLWQFGIGSGDGFQPSGDPFKDHFTQAIRYAVGLDNPADAEPGLSQTLNLRGVERTARRPGLLGSWTGHQGAVGGEDRDGWGEDSEFGLSAGDKAKSDSGGSPNTGDAVAKALADYRAKMIDAEGYRRDVYADTRGILTVGIGHKVSPKDNLKIGDVVGNDRVEQFFNQDASASLAAARSMAEAAGIDHAAFIPDLAAVNFQLGSHWLATFPKAWAAIKAGNYGAAARHVATSGSGTAPSKWMKQSPTRVRAFQAALRALPPKPTEGTQ